LPDRGDHAALGGGAYPENLLVHSAPPFTATIAIVSLLASSACTVFGGGSSPAPVIKIGVDLPLSGDEGRVAKPALNGIQYYVQKHPTIDGFAVSLVTKDDSVGGVPEPLRGAANIQSLAADPLVMAVIGPFDSSVARAEIPVANPAWLAMVSPATGSPCLTKSLYLPAALNPTRTAITCKDAGLPAASELRPSGANNYFRLSTTDDLQGPAAADYAYNTLHIFRLGVVFDHEPYGEALAAGFSARFVQLGGSVVGRLDLDPAAKPDAVAFLKRVRADGAQAVYFGGITANKGCVIRSQMAGIFDAGQASPYLGGDGIAEDPGCVQDAGANAAGIYATVPAVDPASVPAAASVIAGFKAAYPKAGDYGPYTMLGYDAAAVVYHGLDQAIKAWGGHRPPRGSVISKLAATQSFAGTTGVIGFDSNGDTTHRIVSIYEPATADLSAPWTHVGTIDYTAALPY
jgi:branched-chain amino acid transport system substrate-binding protein